MKSSRAISDARWFEVSSVSGTISLPILRVYRWGILETDIS
jgi:hypothetical protein